MNIVDTNINSVQNLDATFDVSYSLHQHTLQTCRQGYFKLRLITSTGNPLTVNVTKMSIVCTLVKCSLSTELVQVLYTLRDFKRILRTAATILVMGPISTSCLFTDE